MVVGVGSEDRGFLFQCYFECCDSVSRYLELAIVDTHLRGIATP
jgi:hypothetical protein